MSFDPAKASRKKEISFKPKLKTRGNGIHTGTNKVRTNDLIFPSAKSGEEVGEVVPFPSVSHLLGSVLGRRTFERVKE